MKLGSLVAPFLRHRELLGRAARTRKGERAVLERLVAFLAERGVEEVEALNRDALAAFQEELAEAWTPSGARLRPQTQRGYLTVVRHFARWLYDEDLAAVDLSRSIRLPRREHGLPKEVIDPPEMRALLAAAPVDSVLGLRDRTMLEVLWSTGMRVSELAGIRVEDVDLEGGYVRVVRAKGGRMRVVPLGEVATTWVREYLTAARPSLEDRSSVGSVDGPLFLSRTGRGLERSAIAWMVRKHCRAAGITKHVTPHCFRVTCATGMLRNGAHVRHLQELLGHRTVATLDPYLKLTVTELKEAHARHHPREQMDV